MTSLLTPQTSKIKPLFDYLNKQKENERFIKTIEIAGTIFLISFFMFFAIKPTVFTISSLLGDIESKKILKKELRSKINNVIMAQELFSQVQENYQVVNASLPDNPEYYQAAFQVQKESEAAALIIDRITFGLNNPEEEDKSDVKSYTISIGVKGGFQSASQIVSELIKNQRIINIGSINFSTPVDDQSPTASPSASTDGNTLDTLFSAKLYYWPATTPDEKK